MRLLLAQRHTVRKHYFLRDETQMNQSRKSLKQLKSEAKAMGYGVRKWAAMAGLPWQSLYRKINREDTLLLHEYDKLEAAVEQMKGESNGTQRQTT
jgi:hypothetical protein